MTSRHGLHRAAGGDVRPLPKTRRREIAREISRREGPTSSLRNLDYREAQPPEDFILSPRSPWGVAIVATTNTDSRRRAGAVCAHAEAVPPCFRVRKGSPHACRNMSSRPLRARLDCRPAFTMRTIDGMPMSSMVWRRHRSLRACQYALGTEHGAIPPSECGCVYGRARDGEKLSHRRTVRTAYSATRAVQSYCDRRGLASAQR